MRRDALALLALLLFSRGAAAQPTPAFRWGEGNIAEAHAAIRAGQLSCRQLVQGYLDRIAAYDKQGPAINAIVVTHPRALVIADSLDAARRAGAPMGPLHCVPMLVKDNMETHDLPTTAGSLALAGWVPRRDATMVARVRAAGAVILAKTNLAEWAFTPYETVSSILPGYTKNPYALDRVTAGSSGGTAAGVAAGEGLVGLGTDTGNSIRGPSSHTALVGIRSTMGLTSRAGVIPLNLSADIAGPMARTVEDAVRVFDVVAGHDPEDAATGGARTLRAPDYSAFLVRGRLRGARIGVLRQAYVRPTLDTEVDSVFRRALDAMRAAGAEIVEPVGIDSLDALLRRGGACNPFAWDFARHMAERGGGAPVSTVAEVLKSGRFHPTVQPRLEAAAAVRLPPEETPGCFAREWMRERLRFELRAMMDAQRLDAVVYPTWSNVPRLIGDLNTPHGDNSQLFAPLTGFPALTVPMGYTRGGTLPAGVTFLGRAWDEGRLIGLAYDYEQGTRHRRGPGSMPEITGTR